MKDLSRSAFVFDLIEEFEIFNATGEANVFTEEAYHSFCKKYKTLSSERDRALSFYLTSTHNVFRCHLPRSKWVLGVAMHVVWYYDELVISDPVLETIKAEPQNVEQNKQRLQIILSNLKAVRKSIETGYLLLSGDDMIPIRTPQFEHESELLVENPNILRSFERISAFGKKPAPINDISGDNLTQLEAMYDGHFGTVRPMAMYFPPHVLEQNKIVNGINYDFMSPYTRSSRQEIIDLGRGDMLNGLIDEYKKDIAIVLETIANAQSLGLPVLFYRDVDSDVAKEYVLKSTNQSQMLANTSLYNCILPYIDGIPLERLAELRHQLPAAFSDFRAFLFDLVKRTMSGTNNPAEINYKIDNEITSKLRLLDVEMKNATRKLMAHGYGAPILYLTGILAVNYWGVDYNEFLSLVLGSQGIVKTTLTHSDVKADKEKAALNPVYFLWKAQHK